MTKSQTIGARLGLAMLGAGMLWSAAPLAAQTGNPALDSPGEALSRNLRSLAENPKSVVALVGAGKAALELGDPQAAITFFGRAEEQAPRDGRIKMWLGAALVQLQQPQGALKFFAEATSMGVPETEVAGQRGLAYDLLGDPRRAQRDYRMALQMKPSAEISRHLALSLAISGEREPALRVLEDQLLIRDRAAERTRAFVLALTGDAPGAARAVQASMPAQSAAFAPFLERLPVLSPSERALAVHFGHFPSHARNLPAPRPNTYAALDPATTTTRAGAPDSRQSALGSRNAAPAKSAPRTVERQPAQRTAAAKPAEAPKTEAPRSSQPATRGGNSQWAWSRGVEPVRRTTPEQPKPAAPTPQETAARTAAAPVQQHAAAAPALVQPQPQRDTAVLSSNTVTPPASVPVQIAGASPPAASTQAAPSAPANAIASATPGFSISPGVQQPLPELASVEAPPPASSREEEAGASRLAGIASLIASLPEEPEQPAQEPVKKAAPAPAKTAAAAPTKPAAKKETPAAKKEIAAKAPATKAAAKKETPAEKKPAAPAEPKRIWVQVAGGADKAALPREFARLKTKAPKLLAARAAWTTPLKATNRLLVGPFKTDGEAQTFVNELKKASLTGFAWTSEAGQKIEKLSAR